MNDTPETFEDMLDQIHAYGKSVMIDRQIKYGPHNIPEFGEFGTLVRMNDKFARLKNLIINGQGANSLDESIDDTLIDVANYALIMLCQRRGWWTVNYCPPLAQDSHQGGYVKS